MSVPMPLVVAPHPARWRILGFLGAAQLMLILDVTVVAIALPMMQADLDLSRQAMTWAVSAYTLAFGGLLLVGGRIVDLVGAKRVVLTGLAVFTVSSLVTGLATAEPMLLAGRVGQGVGAALLSPAALSLVVTLFDGAERAKALGVWSALGGGGAAVGMLVGGLLTAGPGWPWVFLVNVPIGIVVAIAVSVMLPGSDGGTMVGAVSHTSSATAARPRGARIDWFGALIVTASTAALTFALIAAGDTGWMTWTTGVLVLAAAAGYTVFAWWQRRAASPLVDLGLLARRPVVTGVFHVLIATALTVAVLLLGTFYFQHALGLDALQTGLMILPVAVATIVGATLTGRLLPKFGARTLGAGGFVLAAVGLAVPALSLDPVTAVVGVTIAGAGLGAAFVVASATALGQVAPHEAGIASGIVSTFHEFGAGLGAAVISSVAAASIVGDTLVGFDAGFEVAAILAVVAAVIAAVLTPRSRRRPSDAGAEPAAEETDSVGRR